MKVKEVVEKVLLGEIEVDLNGHTPYHGPLYYFEKCKEKALFFKERGSPYSFYETVEAIEPDAFLIMADFIRCHTCGMALNYSFDGNKVKLDTYFKSQDRNIHKQTCRCEFENVTKTSGTIDVIGNMILTNWFSFVEDSSEEDRHTEGWSLNYIAGRVRITEYKAKRNVAYGQLGNTSYDVYVHNSGKSVILTMQWLDDEDEYKILDGYTNVGSVCCDAWRWEASSTGILGAEETSKFYEDAEKRHKDVVEFPVVNGKWKFEHFYGFSEEESFIFAKLELQE